MVDKIVDVALRKSVRRSKQYDGYFEDYYTANLRRSKEIIVLDVGGTKFYVLKSTFATWPTTRFQRVNKFNLLQNENFIILQKCFHCTRLVYTIPCKCLVDERFSVWYIYLNRSG